MVRVEADNNEIDNKVLVSGEKIFVNSDEGISELG